LLLLVTPAAALNPLIGVLGQAIDQANEAHHRINKGEAALRRRVERLYDYLRPNGCRAAGRAA
jgi:hypothetical protein